MSFFDNLSSFGDRPCLIDEQGQVLTYRQVACACDTLADSMPPGKQLVVIRAANTVETIIGYLTCLRRGDAVLMLDDSLNRERSISIYDRYRSNMIWEKRNQSHKTITEYGNYALHLRSDTPIDMHPDLALLLSTSGSTGTPKMVKLTRENLIANCRSILAYLPIQQTDTAITSLPLHYSYGLSILHTHLAVGASILVTGVSVMTPQFWEMMERHAVSTLQGVPYHYEMFERIGLMKKKLPALRYLTQAGGKLNVKLVETYLRWAQENAKTFYVMYGQTEATARISYLPPENALEKCGSIGIAIPGGALEIRDIETGEVIVEAEREGELIYRGPNVMLGYAETAEDLNEEDACKGVLTTGDIAYRDQDGFFTITGRIKRFIKMYGNRISLDAIEHQLKEEGFDVQCTGRDDLLLIATTQKESIDKYLDLFSQKVEEGSRAQTKPLDGILVKLALEGLRARYPGNYVAIRTLKNGRKVIVVSDYHKKDTR